ncbi:hypothetical protein AURDEDRAFT_122372 [Auricularia subglabra TFB-10046 SS5]|nr:hypothetical protein AURDEDRAFT_122372 [Auricularia subglabra TFB-10046 SS5]
MLFNASAPRLRTVTLHEAFFPSSCPAFGHATHLTVKQRWRFDSIDIETLFKAAPLVQELELIHVASFYQIPPIPPYSRLSKVTLACAGLSFDKLIHGGYLGLPFLYVRTRRVDVLSSALEDHPASFRATLSIFFNGDIAVYLRGEDGASARFMTQSPHIESVRALLGTASRLQRIQHLVLPSDALRMGVYLDATCVGPRHHPYLSSVLQLPSLRTLTISRVLKGHSSLFGAELVRGTIDAPLLERVEIVGNAESTRLRPIDPDDLVEFVAEHVICGTHKALELFIDTRGGVTLKSAGDALERLRGAVGKLIMWYTMQSTC